jgi:hypothetical protein
MHRSTSFKSAADSRQKDNAYVYEVTGTSGKLFRFDLATGAPRASD